MTLTKSQMTKLGRTIPFFSLKDPFHKTVSLDDFEDNDIVLVMFICNHCPFVVHIHNKLVKLAKKYQDGGVGVVAINSNDVDSYPEDHPKKMKEMIIKHNYTFPYLYDEDQNVAKEFEAACTPDFFVYARKNSDIKRTLVYRGRFDQSSPSNNTPVTGKDLVEALDCAIKGKTLEKQSHSMGCNIKWRPGNEPSYF